MKKEYTCYCGLYCQNCAVKVKVEPASKTLFEEMKKAGFEDIMQFLPNGDTFWTFLKGMAIDGVCISCREGSGNPGCEVRKCAQEKNVEMCAFCKSYPCDLFTNYFEGYPVLKQDNAVLLEEGFEAWEKLQDERFEGGITYSDLAHPSSQ